jgi:hypothetical protein
MEHVKDMLEHNCNRCLKELTDQEYKIKVAKKDDLSIYTPSGFLFYLPSYIHCTKCKRDLLTADLIVSSVLISCIICLFFAFF